MSENIDRIMYILCEFMNIKLQKRLSNGDRKIPKVASDQREIFVVLIVNRQEETLCDN